MSKKRFGLLVQRFVFSVLKLYHFSRAEIVKEEQCFRATMQIVFLFILLLGCSNVNKKSDSNDSVHLMNSDTAIAKDNTESLGVFSGVYAFDPLM